MSTSATPTRASCSPLLIGLKIGPHPWVWRVAKPLLAIAGALGGMFLLGVMTSFHFDITLQRAGFTSEGVWDWLVWGRRTSFPPFVILVMVAVPVSLVAVLRRVLLASSARLRTGRTHPAWADAPPSP